MPKPKGVKTVDPDSQIKVYLTPEQKALFQRWADADGRSLSRWLVKAGEMKAAADERAAEKKGGAR